MAEEIKLTEEQKEQLKVRAETMEKIQRVGKQVFELLEKEGLTMIIDQRIKIISKQDLQ